MEIECPECEAKFDSRTQEDKGPRDLEFYGVTLINTCSGCPEQYDASYKGEQAGYLRLRWGRLTVEYPDCGGEVIFEAPISDVQYSEEYKMHMAWAGTFHFEAQRQIFLETACLAIYNKCQDPEEKRYIKAKGA